MALVVEDGTGTNPAANSYAAVADLRAFAADRASTVPAVDADCEVLLLKAMDYLEDLNFKGFRFKQFQALKWPRYDVIIDGWPLLLNQIPKQLIYAQCAFAIEYQTVELLPTGQPWDHGSVMSDAISGAVSETYADNARVIYKAAVEKASRFVHDIVRNNGLMAIRS
jgi:hypothetical protein